MPRDEELRTMLIAALEEDFAEHRRLNGSAETGDFIAVSMLTARRTLELLKRIEIPGVAVWEYYTNDEGKARWKCSV